MVNEKRKSWGKWVLFAFTTPYSIVVGWGFPLLMCLIFAAKWSKLQFEPTLVLTTEWKPWAQKKWKYSTTLGRGIVYKDYHHDDNGKIDTRIERHEHLHVEQIEDLMFLSFFIGIAVAAFTGNGLLAFCIWFSGGLWQLAFMLTAWLRGGNPYRDAMHERHAYAETGTKDNPK